VTEWLQWLASLPLPLALRRSATFYMLVNAAHVLSIGLLIGAILPLDLRLAGVIRGGTVVVLAPFLSRCAATGLVLAVITGLCLFSVKPLEYVDNPAFLTKMALLACGLAIIVLQHWGAAWRRMLSGEAVPARVRLLAVLSFVIWTSTLLAGRWIGFV
jgi:Family of unknown function (DUF6644)